MNREDVKTLIRLGFEPARYFKRSAWVKVERVMEFLVNKGEVVKVNGDAKYAAPNGKATEGDIDKWASLYMKSPFSEHFGDMKRLSSETGLPINSKELLNKF